MSGPSPTSSLASPSSSFDAWASAPGRVEFIGNHTDYNGGWVLGSTIDSRIDVGVARRADPTIRMKSSADVPPVQVPHDEVVPQNGDRTWANYVLGVFSVLQDEGVPLQTGVDLSVHSTLPTGAGLSSSAALEVATALALTEMVGEPLDRRTIARVARRAENEFVGVPCGILDQAVVAFGGEDQLVRIDARTNEIGVVPFPSETRLWIFRTHRSHSLADAHYQERHDEAHAARDRLRNRFDDVEHLVDVSPDQLKASRDVLPDPLFRRARHVMTEHRRVQTVVRLLRDGDLEGAGKLLVESHESSRTDYENSTPELDFLVHRLAKESEVLGARLTGAGFGGAAMAWTREGFSRDAARAVEAAYDERFGEGVDVMACQPAPGGIVQSPVEG